MSDHGKPAPTVRDIVAPLSQSLVPASAVPAVSGRALPVRWVRLVLSGLVVLLGSMAVGAVAFQQALGDGLQRVRSVAQERRRMPVPPLPADAALLNDADFAVFLRRFPEHEHRLRLGRGRALIAVGRPLDAAFALTQGATDNAASTETLLLLAQVQRDVGAVGLARSTLLRLDWRCCSPSQRQQAVRLLASTAIQP